MNIKSLPTIFAFSFLIIPLLCWGNFGLFYHQDLAGTYEVQAINRIEQAMIVSKEDSYKSGVGPMVFAYGWNEDFIIAKQHPLTPGKLDTNITNWFVIEVASSEVHGPLTEEEYLELRQTLGVPDLVAFTELIELEDK